MLDYNDTHEVGIGLSLNGDIGLFAGVGNPWSLPVTNAPIGSRYFRQDGVQFYKIGVGDLEADWERITRNSFGSAPLTLTFTATTLNNLDYLSIGSISNSKAAQAVPYDTTLVAIACSYESVTTGLALNLYLDNLLDSTIMTLVADAAEGVQSDDDLHIHVPALTRIKVRGSGAGQVKNVVVNLVFDAVIT